MTAALPCPAGGDPQLVALRHRAEVVVSAVRLARRQLGAIAADDGEGGAHRLTGCWVDVLHALEKSAELAHLVAELAERPPIEIAPPAYGFTAPASITLRIQDGLAHYPLARVDRAGWPPG